MTSIARRCAPNCVSVLLVVTLSIAVSACGEKKQVIGKGWKDEWHGSCKVASFAAPLHFKNRIAYSKQYEIKKYDQIGECRARKVANDLWYVKGQWFNSAMKEDGIAPVPYEAVMYESNDKSDVAVQRYGTQYLVCSIAINGEDLTGSIRLNACGDGRYISEFKRKLGI